MSGYPQTVVIHDYAGHPFQVELSRYLASQWQEHGIQVIHAYSTSTHTPQGCLQATKDDPSNLLFAPLSLGGTIPKYNFVRRFWMEKRYGDLLTQLCDQHQADVVLSGNTPTLAQTKLVRWCRSNDCRVVTWIQDMYGLAAYRILSKKLPVIGALVGKHLMRLDGWCYRNSDAVVPITDDFSPQLLKYGVARDRIHPISNWAPLDEMPMCDRENEWSKQQGLTDKTRFLYAGTLSVRHNPELLLELAKEVERRDCGQVIVVSEGEASDWLRSESESLSSLKVLPFQPFEDLPNVLGAADVLLTILDPDAGVFCVPSKVLSYLCAGRALLTSIPSNNQAARLIETEFVGFNSDSGDDEAFVKLAMKLADSKEIRDEMGARARGYAEETFEITKIASKFAPLLGVDGSERWCSEVVGESYKKSFETSTLL